MSAEYIKALAQCLYAIAGIIGVAGVFNVYVVMNDEQNGVWKHIAKTIIAIVILCGIAVILESVYIE